ncbi:uncharacterized protein I206_106634 [Kwoniella pini CBS 10737]|uniref:Nucleolar 27S pre-rRNA processing Urb2/Npa2 C-terminal domain-containing protein n=1 Tax=Kwoniella pini CBS 10737 TaxID=1296096 RepID=A0AAJ8LBQ6_9TREE
MATLLFQPALLSSKDTLQPILSQLSAFGAHSAISALFDSLIHAYHEHRYSIFTQASSSKVAHDVFVASKEREEVRLALEQILSQVGPAYATRLSLWNSIETWGGYMERESSWSQLVRSEAQIAEQTLSSGDSALLGPLLKLLATLENLDHDQAQLSSNVVRWCLALLLESLDGLFVETLPDETIISLYNLTVAGPLTGKAFQRHLTQSLRSINIGKGRATPWHQICDSILNRLSSIVTPASDQKKRKRSATPPSHSVASVGIATRLLARCLIAAAGTTHDTNSSLDTVAKLSALIDEWPGVDETVRKSTTKSLSWDSAVLEAGRLRIVLNLEKLSSYRSSAADPVLLTSAIPELTIEMQLSAQTIDELFMILEDAPAHIWQLVLDQGLVLIDASATSAQLRRLAKLISRKSESDDTISFSSAPLWELPNVKNLPEYPLLNICPPTYLDKKVKLQVIDKTWEGARASAWLYRLASEGDTLELMSRNTGLLHQVIKIASTGDEPSTYLFEKAVKNVDSFSALREDLVNLTSMNLEVHCDTADLKALHTRNILLQAKQWLNLRVDDRRPLGPSLCKAFIDKQSASFARIILETIASESTDPLHIVAAALYLYNHNITLELESTLYKVLKGSIDQAMSECCVKSPTPAHLRLLAALCSRCDDMTLIQRAIDTALAAPSNDLAVITFFEKIVEDKASILRHDDVVRVFAIITQSIAQSAVALQSSFNILMSLSRRRADLILANLPELVDILSSMFVALQTFSKAKTPHTTDAQMLSRLLVALTQIRLGRRHETSPLAKHVPAILVAYVRAAGDMHSGFSPMVRRDLEPGLFGLCNLVTAGGRAYAHGREGEGLGTPFGLGEGTGGEGEKELWAELWRSWSKSRYLGQG